MPMFFFDTDDGHSCSRDDEGCEVSDLRAARNLALEAILAIASDQLPLGEHRVCVVDVRDEAGHHVYRAKVEVAGKWLL